MLYEVITPHVAQGLNASGRGTRSERDQALRNASDLLDALRIVPRGDLQRARLREARSSYNFV